MTDPPFSFNLWHAPWIRVVTADGEVCELSIHACLARAHELRALHDPSPLVVAGVHRLLAAILQAIYQPTDLDALEGILATGQFDNGLLDAFAAQHAGRFDLFHPTTPFLQTGDVPLDGWRKPERGRKNDWGDPKAVSALFNEVPGATNRTHFHHVTDEGHQVCPACCARGLLTIAAFASSGGPGIRPSINGVPPIYVLPVGRSLFEGLTLSLVAADYLPAAADRGRADIAGWNGSEAVARGRQVSAVGYIESLTFPARRMRLYPKAAAGRCTQCDAATSVAVSEMLFEMGHWLNEGVGVWDDPFAAFREPGGKNKVEGRVPVRPQEGKALWREYGGLLLAEREEQLRPRVVRQLGMLVDRDVFDPSQAVQVRCISIRTDGKAKFFEWLDEALEAPPALLADPVGATYVEDALRWSGEAEREMGFVFDRHFRPKRRLGERINQKVVRYKMLRARMLATYWERMAPAFRALTFAMAVPEARDDALRGWADTLVRTGRRVFDEASGQVGERADALRAQVEAQAHCAAQLSNKQKEWLHE
ncbi:MAG: hypothetical protein RLZZ387_1702 [Chloroflexota bacterium]